jgi:hypothetical protein
MKKIFISLDGLIKRNERFDVELTDTKTELIKVIVNTLMNNK